MFPFPELRKGQDAMLDDCRAAFTAGKHLLAHAPTGLGKTAAALTAAIEVAREQGLLVVALTSRQTQHAIFVETLKRIHAQHPLKIVDVIS
ncbi:MAG: DEAD/DEAH box helicase, partial [Candidatus Thermoplasmatota archaeon]|nr:DEAD/DEAH box helicase [Candidatus Thermoplasmatota archaeon]